MWLLSSRSSLSTSPLRSPAAGSVPLMLFTLSRNFSSDGRRSHASGMVPDILLNAMSRSCRSLRALQAGGRVPLSRFPSSSNTCSADIRLHSGHSAPLIWFCLSDSSLSAVIAPPHPQGRLPLRALPRSPRYSRLRKVEKEAGRPPLSPFFSTCIANSAVIADQLFGSVAFAREASVSLSSCSRLIVLHSTGRPPVSLEAIGIASRCRLPPSALH
mmetsp:Transcript_18419/g.32815  ORF Transcript_18419/g.32815 Transcript_18419/m.32815 type:complete len:215 (-) Transcript_18419:528-1172(-)